MAVNSSSSLDKEDISFSITLLVPNRILKLHGSLILELQATSKIAQESSPHKVFAQVYINERIRIANGTFCTIASVGSIPISKSLTLCNVLHIPNV